MGGAAAESGSSTPRRRASALPGRAICGALLVLLSLLCWAFASPVGSSPDDDFHIANIYCLHDESTCRSNLVEWPDGQPGWPADPADRTGSQWQRVQDAYPDLWGNPTPRQLPCYVRNGTTDYNPDPTVPADCLNLEDSNANTPASIDNLGYYPANTYRLLSIVTQETIRESVAAWRIAVCLLVTGLAVASVGLSMPTWRRAVLVSWLVCAVPGGMFLFSSHNPSAVAVAGAVAIVGPGIALLRERGKLAMSLMRGGLLLLGLLLTMGGRSEGVVFGLGALLVAVIFGISGQWWRSRGLAVVAGCAVVGVLVIAAVTGLSTSVERISQTYLYQASTGDSPWTAVMQAPTMLALAFEPLGWLDITLPPAATVVSAVAFFGALMLGLAQVDSRKGVGIAVTVSVAFGAPVAIWTLSGSGIQVRYMLPFIFLMTLAVLSPTRSHPLVRWSRPQWWLMGLAWGVANCVALFVVILRYTAGLTPGSSPLTLAAMETPAWWWQAWLPPTSNWVVGAGAFAAALALLLPWVAGQTREDRTMGTDQPERVE